jgi:hypothetical protein|tara:strand:- start:397 stop:507 length:111 start_codon:yes stop_codon:yes gene_type:complete
MLRPVIRKTAERNRRKVGTEEISEFFMITKVIKRYP